MAETIIIDHQLSKKEQYIQLLPQIKNLIQHESDLTANLANICAVLKYSFNFFWVGFYLLKEDELVLNAFQGPVACTRIKMGKGVCGAAAQRKETIVVPNVNEFPGHIACSSASQSEIVVPILIADQVVGVLDVDSIHLNSFDQTDQHFLEQIALLIAEKW